jgi:hypothetical protein
MGKYLIRNFVDRSTGCTQVARPAKHRPAEGDVRYFDGIRFVYSGGCWGLDQVIDSIIDHHHNYRGHQDAKRPYNRVAAVASLLR